jgi:hypothetical protein
MSTIRVSGKNENWEALTASLRSPLYTTMKMEARLNKLMGIKFQVMDYEIEVDDMCLGILFNPLDTVAMKWKLYHVYNLHISRDGCRVKNTEEAWRSITENKEAIMEAAESLVNESSLPFGLVVKIVKESVLYCEELHRCSDMASCVW